MQKRSLPMMPAIKPDKHEVLNNKGSALRKLGRYEDAITVYDAALDMKPDKHEALNSKSVSLLQLGRYEDAITLYESLIKQTPKDVSPRYNRACGYALSKQLDNALESLQQAITLDDTNQYIEMAQTDSDFENIRHEPKFIALLKP